MILKEGNKIVFDEAVGSTTRRKMEAFLISRPLMPQEVGLENIIGFLTYIQNLRAFFLIRQKIVQGCGLG